MVLDVSPFVQRDFLPIEQVAAAIRAVLNHDLTGTFNVAPALRSKGRLALWMIEGFGRGELVISSPKSMMNSCSMFAELPAAADWYGRPARFPNTAAALAAG